MASRSPSTARTEQWDLILGSPPRASEASFQVIFLASSRVFPLASSVIIEPVAMFDAQPYDSNLTSVMTLVFSSTSK